MDKPPNPFEEMTASQIIEYLGGPTAVSRLLDAPLSTVFSWGKRGIPKSRMAHIVLAARAAGKIPEQATRKPKVRK